MHISRAAPLRLLFLLAAAVTFRAEVPVAIRTPSANAHLAPNTKSAVLAILRRNETFLVVDDLPLWYKILLKNGSPAFVLKSECTVMADVVEPEETAPAPEALLPSAVVLPAPVPVPACTPTKVAADFAHVCPQDGTGGVSAPLYIQKNRLSIPCEYAPIAFSEMLALPRLPANVRARPVSDPLLATLQRLEAQAVVLDGFLAMVKSGGSEGVNCHSTQRVDVHAEIIDVASDPKLNRARHIVTEVTPWFSAAIPAFNKDSLAKLAAYVDGYSGPRLRAPTHVRIFGFLLFDEAHVDANTVGVVRGTSWEIHPITRIEICNNSGCAPLQ